MSSPGFEAVPLAEACCLITDGSHFSPTPRDEGYPIVNAKDIPKGQVELDTCTRISEREYRLLKSQNCAPILGDVLLSKDGTIGRVVHYKEDLGVVLLSSVAILRPNKIVAPAFLAHALRSHLFDQQLFRLQSGSALKRLVLGDIRKIRVPVPKLEIQNGIAEILSTVDEAIEQTEALIAKYQQIKAGLMQDLFTRGLSPEASAKGDVTWTLRPTRAQAPHLYKESPLGWIPKKWEVKAVNEVLEIERGFAFSSSDYQETGILNFRVSNVGLSKEELQNTEYLPPTFWGKFSKQQLFGGEIVIVMVGATTGKIGRIPVELCPALLNQNLWNLRPLSGFDREFAWNVMPSIVNRHMRLSQGSARDFLKQSDFGKTKTVYPEPEEQKAITEALASISKRIDCENLTSRKLRQQKQGLMQDLLTGRVRVKVGEAEEKL